MSALATKGSKTWGLKDFDHGALGLWLGAEERGRQGWHGQRTKEAACLHCSLFHCIVFCTQILSVTAQRSADPAR